MNYKIRKLCVCLAVALCLVGCSENAQDETTAGGTSGNGTGGKPGSNVENVSPSNVAGMDTSDMFSDRDKKAEYDKSKSIAITLNGGSATSSSSKVNINGGIITISSEGEYYITGKLDNGQIVVNAPDTAKIQLVLDNASISSGNSAAIYVKSADKVFVTTTESSTNFLTTTGKFVSDGDINVDAVIFAKSDITLNGKGKLSISTTDGHGIVSKDDLVITGGTYLINSKSHCIDGKDSVRISDGIYTLESEKDGIHSENSDDVAKGYVYIAGGDITINTSDDGISATSNVQIDGGSIKMNVKGEGIEGYSINMLGGNIDITATDDGINASGGREGDGSMFVNVAGAKVKINANGDGVDSNGNFYVSSGELYILGPTNGANGAVDYAGEGKITGGVVLAVGTKQMAQNFNNASQGTILVNTNNVTSGSSVILKKTDGTEVFSYVVDKAFSSVVLSMPDIKQGESYVLVAGTNEIAIDMTSNIYGGTGGMGGFGGGPMGGFDGGKGEYGGSKVPGGRGDWGDMEMPSGMELPDGMEFPGGMNMPDGIEIPGGIEM